MSVFSNYLDLSAIPSSAATPAASGANSAAALSNLADPTAIPSQDLTFSQFLSAINPLQHIPVVSSIYRDLTGDTGGPAGPAARVIWGTILGGPLGMITAAANAGLEQSTGQDVGDRALALVTPSRTPPDTQYAELASPEALGGSSAAEAAPTPTVNPVMSPSASAVGVPTALPAAAPVAAATPAGVGSPVPIAAVMSAPEGASVWAPAAAALSQGPAGLPASTTPAAGQIAPGGVLGSTTQEQQGKGWSLVDYRMAAGHGLPANAGNNTSMRSTPIPLQTTVPLATDLTRTPVVGPTANPVTAPGTMPPATPTSDSWISDAMMRGLDRYREMKKATDQTSSPTTQYDATF